MRYELKSDIYFDAVIKHNIEKLRRLFAEDILDCYMPLSDFDIEYNYSIEELYQDIENWKQGDHEAFSDIDDEEYLKEAVVKYILVDKYYDYEINILSDILEIDKEKLAGGLFFDPLLIYLKLGYKVLSANKDGIKQAIETAYKLKESYDKHFEVIYNIETVDTWYEYVVYPTITNHYNEREITIKRLLRDNEIMEEKSYK